MVSKLLRQWAREGTAAYYTKPSTPHGHPAATPPATIRAITALRTELGWEPQFTDIRAGLADTVRWYRENEAWWRPAKAAVEATYRAQGQ